MKDFYYNVPKEMIAEKEEIIAKCDAMILEFNERAKIEYVRVQAEKEAKRKAMTFQYSIKEIEDGWKILYKETPTPVEGYVGNTQWSKPFKIINNVLFFARFDYRNTYSDNANRLLTQGIVADNFLETIPNW